MTNLAWIRTLNEEEMAWFLEQVEMMDYNFRFCDHCESWDAKNEECRKDYRCELTMLDYPKMEHEEA